MVLESDMILDDYLVTRQTQFQDLNNQPDLLPVELLEIWEVLSSSGTTGAG